MKRLFLVLVVVFASIAPNVIAGPAIRRVNFRNFTFPGIFEKRITLHNGKSTVTTRNCETQYELDDVVYRDFNHDGQEDALVSIDDFQACGSSCRSEDFYIYTIKNTRPSLLWKFSTGCQGAGGLKDFHLAGRTLVFKLFGKTRIAGDIQQIVGPERSGRVF